MKIITEPSIHLLSCSQFYLHPTYLLPPHDYPTESLIATAGKVCYDSFGLDGNPVDKHISNLVQSKHHSVLEHVHVGLFIEGISRGCSHEIVRHRMFNYSQRSTRYTDESDMAIVLDPYFSALYNNQNNRYLTDNFIQSCITSFNEYGEHVQWLIETNPEWKEGKELRKYARGKARQLLPHALETKMVMTGNLRAWRHFIIMRSSRHAEAEIRRLTDKIYPIIIDIAPNVFADLKFTMVNNYMEITE